MPKKPLLKPMDPVTEEYGTFLQGLKDKEVTLSINQISDLFAEAGNRDAFFAECLKKTMRQDFLNWWSKNTIKLRVLGEKEKVSLLTILTAILMLDAEPEKAFQSMNLIGGYINNSDIEIDELPNNTLLTILYRLFSAIDNAEMAFRACSVFYSSVEMSSNVAEPMGGELLEDDEKYTEYVIKSFLTEKGKRPVMTGPAAFALHLLNKNIIKSDDISKVIVGRLDAAMYELKEVYVLDRDGDTVDIPQWERLAQAFADDGPSAYTVLTWNAPDITKEWIDNLFDGLTGYIPVTNNHLDFTKMVSVDDHTYEIHSLIDTDSSGIIDTIKMTYTDNDTGLTRDLADKELDSDKDFGDYAV